MRLCGFRWPWPGPEKITSRGNAVVVHHSCGLEAGHLGGHLCRCSISAVHIHLNQYTHAA